MRLIIGVSACFCLAFGFVERSSTKLRISQCLHNLQLKRDSSVCDSTEVVPVQSSSEGKQQLFSSLLSGAAILAGVAFPRLAAIAEDTAVVTSAPKVAGIPKVAEIATKEVFDMGSFKLPYNHENLLFKDFLGKKATIVFNMKIDDPQTVTQFPNLLEIYKKYAKEGLNVHAFPTEQGWFEPDDDETVRAKSREYYGFGNYPTSVVFDKVDLLGPSAHPLYSALTKSLITPNGYGRITLNYEKFLLDSNGKPLRRYPRKFTAYDMEADIVAVLKGEPLPAESPAFQKAWREAKREAVKSEYSFRYNYNYYTAPDSMYKYNPDKDK